MAGHAGVTGGTWDPFQIIEFLEVNDMSVAAIKTATGLSVGCIRDRDRTRKMIPLDERNHWKACGLKYNHIAAARTACDVDRAIIYDVVVENHRARAKGTRILGMDQIREMAWYANRLRDDGQQLTREAAVHLATLLTVPNATAKLLLRG